MLKFAWSAGLSKWSEDISGKNLQWWFVAAIFGPLSCHYYCCNSEITGSGTLFVVVVTSCSQPLSFCSSPLQQNNFFNKQLSNSCKLLPSSSYKIPTTLMKLSTCLPNETEISQLITWTTHVHFIIRTPRGFFLGRGFVLYRKKLYCMHAVRPAFCCSTNASVFLPHGK